jgi:uncharacterized protein YxjI
MLLDRHTYIVKERVAFAKLTDTYDLLDAGSGQPIGIAIEEPPGWAKWLRLLVNKAFLPTTVNVYEGAAAAETAGLRSPMLSIHRPPSFLHARVAVSLGPRPIGHFRSKLFSLGGAFQIFDTQDREIGLVKGDWKGWNFKMTAASGEELGRVTKKWAGLGKELFTSADTYVIDLAPAASSRPDIAALLLAAGLAIDIVYKEKK